MCMFFHLVLLSPNPTLFPYTPLFRSGRRLVARAGRADARRGGPAPLQTKTPTPPVGRSGLGQRQSRGFLNGQPGEDRKSTRLNSSHLVISYAVLCLKKKK